MTHYNLTVKRHLDGGEVFCTCSGEHCQGEGSRICTLRELTSGRVKSCRRCSVAARQKAAMPDPPLPEATVKIPKCHPLCRKENGYEFHQPDCEKLGVMSRIGWERQPEQYMYAEA